MPSSITFLVNEEMKKMGVEKMSLSELKNISIDDISERVEAIYSRIKRENYEKMKTMIPNLLVKAFENGLMSEEDHEMCIATFGVAMDYAESWQEHLDNDYDAGLLEDIEFKIEQRISRLMCEKHWDAQRKPVGQKFVSGHRNSCPCNDCKAIAYSDDE